jgi:hypothetical protein
MGRRLAAVLLAAVALAGSGASPASAMKKRQPGHTTVLPNARDGDVAVQEELDAARRAGTLAAYDLFLSRHGEHPLAAAARQERAAIRSGTPRR